MMVSFLLVLEGKFAKYSLISVFESLNYSLDLENSIIKFLRGKCAKDYITFVFNVQIFLLWDNLKMNLQIMFTPKKFIYSYVGKHTDMMILRAK